MASTPLSSSTSYASAADFTALRDWRQIAELVNDDDTRLANQAAVEAHATVLKALLLASGWLEAACLRGGMYTPTDLAALTGASAEYRDGIVCDLAFWHLSKRRKVGIKPEDVSGTKEALEALQALREGERIFGLQEVVDAHQIDTAERQNNDDEDQSMPSVQAGRLFGTRADRGS